MIGVMPAVSTALTLRLHVLVGLAEQLAALGVADDDVAARRAWPASPGDTRR